MATETKTVQHTPGPWEAMLIEESGIPTGTYKSWGVDPNVCTIFYVTPEGEANARLISAAPELLEACKEAIKTHDGYEWLEVVEAAIAKAEGR